MIRMIINLVMLRTMRAKEVSANFYKFTPKQELDIMIIHQFQLIGIGTDMT
jgi:hypothetical protein